MTPLEYLTIFGMGALVFIGFAFPLLFSLIVAYVPRPGVNKKILFVLVTAALSYGVGVIVFVSLIPLSLVNQYLVPQWEAVGYKVLTNSIKCVMAIVEWLPIIIGITASIAIPIYGRRGIWQKISEIMANTVFNRTR